MEIKIPTHGWVQVAGDMDPGTFGGTIATANGETIELIEIQPVREYAGDHEAYDVGFPFWSKETYFDLTDLQLDRDEVKSARATCDLTDEILQGMSPERRAVAIACALLDYGLGDEGPSGWAKDVIGTRRVKWWGSPRPQGWRYLADEDREFRAMIRESERGTK